MLFQAFMFLLTVFFHLSIGLPLGHFPSIFISATTLLFSVSFLLFTCPNHSCLFHDHSYRFHICFIQYLILIQEMVADLDRRLVAIAVQHPKIVQPLHQTEPGLSFVDKPTGATRSRSDPQVRHLRIGAFE